MMSLWFFLFVMFAQDRPAPRPSALLVALDQETLRVRPTEERRDRAIRLTSVENGVMFDLDGDGILEQVAWTQPDDELAFLAVDRDGDGMITSGKELFGSQTWPDSPNAIDALTRMHKEMGGTTCCSVSFDDPLYAKLLLWVDRNHNGVSEPDELRPVSEVFAHVGLGYVPRRYADEHENRFRFRGWVAVRTGPGRNKILDSADNAARVRDAFEVGLRTRSRSR